MKPIHFQGQGQNETFSSLSSVCCDHSTLLVPFPILTKLCTQLVNGKALKPIYFQGQRSRSEWDLEYFHMWQPCKHSTLNISWPILIKVGLQLVYMEIGYLFSRSRSKLDFWIFSAVTTLWKLYTEHLTALQCPCYIIEQ